MGVISDKNNTYKTSASMKKKPGNMVARPWVENYGRAGSPAIKTSLIIAPAVWKGSLSPKRISKLSGSHADLFGMGRNMDSNCDYAEPPGLPSPWQ